MISRARQTSSVAPDRQGMIDRIAPHVKEGVFPSLSEMRHLLGNPNHADNWVTGLFNTWPQFKRDVVRFIEAQSAATAEIRSSAVTESPVTRRGTLPSTPTRETLLQLAAWLRAHKGGQAPTAGDLTAEIEKRGRPFEDAVTVVFGSYDRFAVVGSEQWLMIPRGEKEKLAQEPEPTPFIQMDEMCKLEPLTTPAEFESFPPMVFPAELPSFSALEGYVMLDPAALKQFAIPPSVLIPIISGEPRGVEGKEQVELPVGVGEDVFLDEPPLKMVAAGYGVLGGVLAATGALAVLLPEVELISLSHQGLAPIPAYLF